MIPRRVVLMVRGTLRPEAELHGPLHFAWRRWAVATLEAVRREQIPFLADCPIELTMELFTLAPVRLELLVKEVVGILEEVLWKQPNFPMIVAAQYAARKGGERLVLTIERIP